MAKLSQLFGMTNIYLGKCQAVQNFFFRGPGRLSEIWCYGLPSWPLEPFGMIRCTTMASSFTGVKECTKTLHVFENYRCACKNPFWESFYSVCFSKEKCKTMHHHMQLLDDFFANTSFLKGFFCSKSGPVTDILFGWVLCGLPLHHHPR